jgi:hypothetical protein
MTIARNILLQTRSALERQKHQQPHLAYYSLKLRQGQLLVMRSQHTKNFLPTIENKHHLVEDLKHSSVQLLCVDQNLGEFGLKLWADVSKQAKKAVFLRLPSNYKLPNKRNRISWGVKRLSDRIAAALLLLTLSPLFLVLVLLIRVHMPGPFCFDSGALGNEENFSRL